MAKKWKTCGTKEGNPARESWAQLARSGSQSELSIHFILPAFRFNYI